MNSTTMYDLAQMAVCAGPEVARDMYDAAVRRGSLTDAEAAAADMLMEAIEWPTTAELHQTADVYSMIRDGHGDAARTMHMAFATAELERDELSDPAANLLDLEIARTLLDAERWRCEHGLVAAS